MSEYVFMSCYITLNLPGHLSVFTWVLTLIPELQLTCLKLCSLQLVLTSFLQSCWYFWHWEFGQFGPSFLAEAPAWRSAVTEVCRNVGPCSRGHALTHVRGNRTLRQQEAWMSAERVTGHLFVVPVWFLTLNWSFFSNKGTRRHTWCSKIRY